MGSNIYIIVFNASGELSRFELRSKVKTKLNSQVLLPFLPAATYPDHIYQSDKLIYLSYPN